MNKLITGNVTNALFFLPSKRWGWRERFVIKAIQVLEQSNVNCFLICIKGTRLSENAAIYNIRCINMINISSAYLLPGQLYRFYKKILKEYDIDVVHLFSLFHYFTLSWALKSFPKIPLFLDVLYLDQYKKWKRIKNFLLRRVDYIFIAREIDIKVISDFFNFPTRRIISHNLCISDQQAILFSRNNTNQRIVSVYFDYSHSLYLFENLFKGIDLFFHKFRERILLKIVFDKMNFDKTKLALINSVIENFPSNNFEFINISDELSSDCHVVLSKTIIDDYSLNLLKFQIPILIPRGALLYEHSLNQHKNNFYKEGDLRELTNLFAANLLSERKINWLSSGNEVFLKKNDEYVFKKTVIDYYRLSKEKRFRRYANK